MKVQVGNVHIKWLGHATFLIMSGDLVIYTDPFVLAPDVPKADLILITHDHYDHFDKDKIAQISKPDTEIVSVTSVCRQLGGKDHSMNVGQKLEIKGVKVKAVPAYNIGKPYHPKGNEVGFVFTVDKTKIYHAGDTDLIPEMSKLAAEKIDIALLPIGGTYTMDDVEAAEAASVIKPKIVIPMHYGEAARVPLAGDPHKFKKLVEAKDLGIEVRVMG